MRASAKVPMCAGFALLYSILVLRVLHGYTIANINFASSALFYLYSHTLLVYVLYSYVYEPVTAVFYISILVVFTCESPSNHRSASR